MMNTLCTCASKQDGISLWREFFKNTVEAVAENTLEQNYSM